MLRDLVFFIVGGGVALAVGVLILIIGFAIYFIKHPMIR